MTSGKISALIELGVLCLGEPSPGAECSSDPGPHALISREPLSRFENPAYQYPFADPAIPAFVRYPPDTSLESLLGATRTVVFLGAADSPQLRLCLSRSDVVALVFEPDLAVFEAFADAVGPARLHAGGAFCFVGGARTFDPALQDQLPGALFRQGTPAILTTGRIGRDHPAWEAETADYVETLHYRHCLYPLASQHRVRSHPLRTIARDLLYDQQLHAYQNLDAFLTCPDIAPLEGGLPGHTALVVAAGPDLGERLDFLRRNRDRGVILCVNNALKPLAEAGISPHFVIINDTSIASGQVFQHIRAMAETALVAHCLSDLGGGRFGAAYLFGEFMPELFGIRPELDAHGSVITAAFSLAAHLGCARCVFVGGQLASPDPWRLGYARGSLHHAKAAPPRRLTDRHPQLCPVKNPFGDTLYTSLNFKDAALWLTETIRLSGMECVNTSRASILYGQGVRHDPDPVLPDLPAGRDAAGLIQRTRQRPASLRPDPARVREFVQGETARWSSVRDTARTLLALDGPPLLAAGMAALARFDADNTTFLVERFRDFDTRRFHGLVFGDAADRRAQGLRDYFTHVVSMSCSLLQVLTQPT